MRFKVASSLRVRSSLCRYLGTSKIHYLLYIVYIFVCAKIINWLIWGKTHSLICLDIPKRLVILWKSCLLKELRYWIVIISHLINLFIFNDTINSCYYVLLFTQQINTAVRNIALYMTIKRNCNTATLRKNLWLN